MSKREMSCDLSERDKELLIVYAAQLNAVARDIEGDICDVIVSFMDMADSIESDMNAGKKVDALRVRANINGIIEQLQVFDACVQRVSHVAMSCDRLSENGDSSQEIKKLKNSYSCEIEHSTHDATVEPGKFK